MTAQLTDVSQLEVARRIARQHNRDVTRLADFAASEGGYLIFDRRGRLVRWQKVRPLERLGSTDIIFRLRDAKVSVNDVVAFLQARDGSAPHRDGAALYGSTSKKPVEEEIAQ